MLFLQIFGHAAYPNFLLDEGHMAENLQKQCIYWNDIKCQNHQNAYFEMAQRENLKHPFRFLQCIRLVKNDLLCHKQWGRDKGWGMEF